MQPSTPGPGALSSALTLTGLSVAAGIVLFWTLVCRLIARLSGWARLAQAYPDASPMPAERRWRFRSGFMRYGARYGSCLEIGVDHLGLRLCVLAILGPGHPPILVPWRDLSVRFERRVFKEYAELRFRAEPDVPLFLDADLARELAAAAGSSWPKPDRTT